MSRRILVAIALLSASCGGTTDAAERLTPSVSLDSTIQSVNFRDAEAFAYEIPDPAGVPNYSVFISPRDSHTRCVPSGMDYEKGRPAYSLRFNGGPNPIDPKRPGWCGFALHGTWIPNVAASEVYVSEGSTAGTAVSRRAEGDHVEVEADLVFPSGTVRGTVVAIICR